MYPHEMTDKYAKAATKAVKDHLKIKDFIERHSNQILGDLQKSAEEMRDKNTESFKIAFIEKALPTIDSVIHVGSSRDDYINAMTWAKENHTELYEIPPEPGKWLTLLTFVYIVRLAFDEHLEKNTWERIRDAVESLLPNSGFKTAPE